MQQDRYANFILEELSNTKKTFATKEEQLLYEQGLLVGLLTVLIEHDSKNFDIIKRCLDKLK